MKERGKKRGRRGLSAKTVLIPRTSPAPGHHFPNLQRFSLPRLQDLKIDTLNSLQGILRMGNHIRGILRSESARRILRRYHLGYILAIVAATLICLTSVAFFKLRRVYGNYAVIVDRQIE